MTATKMRPRALFSDQEWAELTAPVTWQGPALVLHAWSVIGLAMAAIALSGYHFLVIVIAAMVIGARQLGLGILMHEAAHGLLHRDKRLNDFLGQWLSAAPVGSDLNWYRPYHLTHHRLVQTDEDPDLPLSAPFPVSKASLRRKIVRDLTGQTFFKQRAFAVFAAFFKPELATAPGAEVIASRTGLGRMAVTNSVMLAVLTLLGHPMLYLVGWLLPLATWNPLATRLRNIAEHACVQSDHANPLSQARTTHTNFLERVLIAPYWVAYHAEHHALMYVPCFRLARAHKLLTQQGALENTDIAPGYLSVIRQVTSPAQS
ncbi:MAG: fatty acid desaturase family protein [Parvularculaceae bacterium]|nr:fatty acid desaturase family protein [Parvularculaceae bacterium]